MSYTLASGTPIYAPMDWKSLKGILLPLSLGIVGCIVYLILEFISKLKL
jgi:hypothetical protein